MSEVQLLQKPVEFSTSLGLARVKTCRNRDTSHVTQQIFKQKLRVGLSPRDGASMASQFKKKKKKARVHCFQVSPGEHSCLPSDPLGRKKSPRAAIMKLHQSSGRCKRKALEVVQQDQVVIRATIPPSTPGGFPSSPHLVF